MIQNFSSYDKSSLKNLAKEWHCKTIYRIQLTLIHDTFNTFCQLIKRRKCHHIETSPLICSENQLTGFYVMTTLAFNEFNNYQFDPFMYNFKKRSNLLYKSCGVHTARTPQDFSKYVWPFFNIINNSVKTQNWRRLLCLKRNS